VRKPYKTSPFGDASASDGLIKAITIRQPWAQLVLAASVKYKDIENRVWPTKYRGPLLIHAAKQPVSSEDWKFARNLAAQQDIDIPDLNQAHRDSRRGLAPFWLLGGFIGIVNLVDCVEAHSSPWFEGPYGFVLAKPQPLIFQPYVGKLGLWNCPLAELPRSFSAPVRSLAYQMAR